jgi:dTMP kinase
LTLILDLPVSVGLQRSGKRGGGEGRFESKGIAYHEAVRSAFLKIARDNPRRCVVIDASPDEASVFKSIVAAVDNTLVAGR